MELSDILVLTVIILLLILGLFLIFRYFKRIITRISLAEFNEIKIGSHKDDVIKLLGTEYVLTDEIGIGDTHEYTLMWTAHTEVPGICLVHFVNDIAIQKTQNGLF